MEGSGKFRATLDDKPVLIHPYNNQLDIWVAIGGTPESVVRAGKHSPCVFAIIGGNPEQFKPLFEYYKDVYKHYNHDMKKFRVGVHMHLLVKTVNKLQMPTILYILHRWTGWAVRVDGNPTNASDLIGAEGNRVTCLVGDADEAIDKILHMQELFGLTRFSAHMDVGGPLHPSLMKSIEIFGTKIAPKVREALKGVEKVTA